MLQRLGLTTRLTSARRWAAVLALASGAVQAGVPAADDAPTPAQAAQATAPGASGLTPFNLGLTSTASLRVAWRNTAYGVGVGVGVEGLALDTPPVPEPASASLALAGLAVLGALLARRRLEV
jgi:uncharacterized protein (TIGR03382 family)